eukprot:TRINITY_DN2547_c0_g1_i1.p1 TRINITY_DN2547_c0_g1~~TRINITY_DN2547_c0_g1_i1.p1  ORF type:complete len:226 (+),score=66.26 TRINITY_DN2547_c0_g1_i1:90-767(+)
MGGAVSFTFILFAAALSLSNVAAIRLADKSFAISQSFNRLSGATSEDCGPTSSIETPRCTVTNEAEGYEIRKYPAGQMWASTPVPGTFKEARVGGFYRCFYYISGQNSENRTIEMTAPVLTQPLPNASGFRISFFVPSQFDMNSVPKPDNPNVTIVYEKEAIRAVLGPFGGFPTDEIYQRKWAKLQQHLDRDGVRYNASSMTYADYDSPFRIINRRQEVWVDILL